MNLTGISRARPGTSVDILCIVLGIDGPHAYETSYGGSSVYARVQLADESSPDGVALLFFGPAAHRVLSFRPLLPIYFSQIAVKQPDRYGVVSLVWCASRSNVNRNPSRTPDRDALEKWSGIHLGPLVSAARDGYLKAQRGAGCRRIEMDVRDPRDARLCPPHHAAALSTAGTRINVDVVHKQQHHPMHLGMVRPTDTGGSFADVAAAAAAAAADAPCLIQLRILGAKFATRCSRKRTRGSGLVSCLTPEIMQSLVQGGCQKGCTASASSFASSPELHLAGCRRATYVPFWLHAADARDRRHLVLVNDSAAERVMLGVRACDVRVGCRGSAARAVGAIHALVREQGPFSAVLSVVREATAAIGSSAAARYGPGTFELLQLFV
jgi:hypothetical protein